jgi:hypothetical protein
MRYARGPDTLSFGYLFLTRTYGARPSGRLRRSRRKRRSAQAKKSNSLATASETKAERKAFPPALEKQ